MLNARRHRGGDHLAGVVDPHLDVACSTPGGIGAAITTETWSVATGAGWCSTPGGIGAAITRPAPPPTPPVPGCSTPGGIGAAITWVYWRMMVLMSVLNARRHRGGDHGRRGGRAALRARVLNARRHRGGDHSSVGDYLDAMLMCSTPGGIGAAITGGPRAPPSTSRQVLNARRHRGGDHWSVARRSVSGFQGAQRPEASGRRSPDRGTCAARPVPVLNARRHRGGDHWITPTPGEVIDVLNARRHRGGDHRRLLALGSEVVLVLNARRHRGGDHDDARVIASHVDGVLNARRHRGGDHSGAPSSSARSSGAQRPEASGRRSQGEPPDKAAERLCSTPGGIGAAITVPPGSAPGSPGRCSTPGGIGAAITMDIALQAGDWYECSTPGGIGAAITRRRASRRRARPCAQRPEASGRRSQPPEKLAALPNVAIRQTRISVRRWREHEIGDRGSTNPRECTRFSMIMLIRFSESLESAGRSRVCHCPARHAHARAPIPE